MNNAEPIIKVTNLWKKYGLETSKSTTNPNPNDGPWSLQDINFEIKKGEVLGVVGRNGAGKSTLLKVLAGVSPANFGSVTTNGRIFPMIELSAGMHMDLSGRENVRLLGAVMGIPKRELESKIPEIEDFCELESWFDKPVYQYSSGMLARLGFAVAMNIDADILLIDEVLSVGDYVFQKKAINKMSSLINSGATVLLVSHSPYTIERICNQAILLDHGKLLHSGNPAEVLSEYYKKNMSKMSSYGKKAATTQHTNRAGSGDARVTSVELKNEFGESISELTTNKPCYIVINYEGFQLIKEPYIHISVTDTSNTVVTYITNIDQQKEFIIENGPGCLIYYIHDWNLLPGTYALSITISLTLYRIDIWTDALTFQVNADVPTLHRSSGLGLVYLNPQIMYGKEGDINFFTSQQFRLQNFELKGVIYPSYIKRNRVLGAEHVKFIVVSYLPTPESQNLMKAFIDSIFAFTEEPFELWVVDNNSPIENIQFLTSDPRINLLFNRKSISDGSLANAVGIELGLKTIDQNSKLVMTFHQDTAPVKKGWFSFLKGKLNNKVKAAGVRLEQARNKDGVLHVLGMLFDFQLFKSLNIDFYPELPHLDTGDKVTVKFKEAGYDIYSTPNSHCDPSLISALNRESIYHQIQCDRSLNDDNQVIFLHLGRGSFKSKSMDTNELLKLSQWYQFINRIIINNEKANG